MPPEKKNREKGKKKRKRDCEGDEQNKCHANGCHGQSEQSLLMQNERVGRKKARKARNRRKNREVCVGSPL